MTPPPTEIKLLPCPFCGGKAIDTMYYGTPKVTCTECGIYTLNPEAIHNWNTRFQPSPYAGNVPCWKCKRNPSTNTTVGLCEECISANTRTPQPPSQDAIKKAAEILYNNRGAVAHYKKEEIEQILTKHLNPKTR